MNQHYRLRLFSGLIIFVLIKCQIFILADSVLNPRVCVIGAGIAGLCTARYLKEAGIDFTVFEATRYVGGTWRYDPRVGYDENGLPLYTSMYKDLHTNLPKVTMELKDFPLPKDTPEYPSWEIYYDYLKSYAKHFDLKKHIQFLHNVISVKRVENIWKVKYKEVITGEEFTGDYDFVVVGNGHQSKPHWPNITGEKLFKGSIIHSHDYRIRDPYKCRRVLLIGAGPSGMDIAVALTGFSKRVIHSHHSGTVKTPFPPNYYVKKPDVKEFNETGVIFVDGTYEELDDVIYCTGYEYDFPFLDESSGLDLQTRSVVPLYKYMVNIHQPTMLMLGLVVRACFAIVLDAQARYAAALIKGNFTLPSYDEMMAEWQRRWDVLQSKGEPLSHIHILADKEDDYYAGLTMEAGIERVPPVISKIRARDTQAKQDNQLTYRNYAYTIIDNENFIRTLKDPHPQRKQESCTS